MSLVLFCFGQFLAFCTAFFLLFFKCWRPELFVIKSWIQFKTLDEGYASPERIYVFLAGFWYEEISLTYSSWSWVLVFVRWALWETWLCSPDHLFLIGQDSTPTAQSWKTAQNFVYLSARSSCLLAWLGSVLEGRGRWRKCMQCIARTVRGFRNPDTDQ